ncbi:hypothetical protein K493DRAFT_360468 [Basidiobolus meristosporus CBS 931.73]|uniref:Mechanosensitive ion channel protein n=1 Tax=Basidiobolus meristosporus CBS 931.73 TaxID=1314790 RepID=A0A1Y1XHP5_9FUNG|nr:hypothetical protein K493DRAFT_291998 [Basidiobolus meristosporus CBS 931.73]ORX85281.1 hypothetical protein K493DRAFT_360468 [Basidiobolus meristosporus CBS 931.73]|eukprot:ORX83454.1 hypothetical protein K493DRAFT_291998 [Basidiobolus meristosporus CBS 931.73]
MAEEKADHSMEKGAYDLEANSSKNSIHSSDDDISHLALKMGAITPEVETRWDHFMVWLYRFNLFQRTAILVLPVDCIFGLIAALDFTVFRRVNISGVTLGWWCVFAIILWSTFFLSRVLIHVLPNLLEMLLGELTSLVKQYMNYVRQLHNYISFLVFCIVTWVLFEAVIATTNDFRSDWLKKIYIVLIVTSAAVTIEKLFLQVIAVKFHKASYQDRILINRYAINIINKLAEFTREREKEMPIIDDMSSHRRPKFTVFRFLSQTKNALEKTTSTLGTIASDIATGGTDKAEPFHAVQSSHDARVLARRIFAALCPPEKKAITVREFKEVFQTVERAERAFVYFDQYSKGDIVRDDLILSLQEIYQEKQALTKSLKDLDKAIAKLDSILMAIVYVIVVLVLVASFVSKFETYIATAGSILVAVSFMTGSSAQAVFESIVFLFVRHPFDVGDRVNIDDKSYIVKEMGLLSTVFETPEGTVVIIPNNSISGSSIENIRRSGDISEILRVLVDSSTTMKQIHQLELKLVQFLNECSREFKNETKITLSDFPDPSQMTLEIEVPYKGNWQNESEHSKRRNMFMFALKDAVSSVGITYHGVG